MEHELKQWTKGFSTKGWEVVYFGKRSQFAHKAMMALYDPKIHAWMIEPKE